MVAKEAIVFFLSEFHLQVEEIEKVYARLEEKVGKAQKGPVTEEPMRGYWWALLRVAVAEYL